MSKIISGGQGNAQDKIEAMKKGGGIVITSPANIGKTLLSMIKN